MTESEQLRDKAIAKVRVANADWMKEGLLLMDVVSPGAKVTGEDLRKALTLYGLASPTHPNAWGALVRTAVKRGRLIPTNELRNMTDPRSHARLTRVYQTA